jgi:hypothetical protein
MLEAADVDLAFIISLKRSTLIFSYPQAGRPITPSLPPITTKLVRRNEVTLCANRDLTQRSKIRAYSITLSARMRGSGTSQQRSLDDTAARMRAARR